MFLKKLSRVVLSLGVFFAVGLNAVAGPRVAQQLTKAEFLNLLNHSLPGQEARYPTEVIGHLGFDRDYFFPLVLNHRLSIQVGAHDKRAVHMVPFSKEGLGADLLRLMNQDKFAGQGLVAVLITPAQLEEQKGTVQGADFLVVAETGDSISDLFADLVLGGMQAKAGAGRDAYVYVEEGGKPALEAALRLAAKAERQLREEDAELLMVGDLNFFPQTSANGHMAATALAMLHEDLEPLSPKLRFLYTHHHESTLGARYVLGPSAAGQRSFRFLDTNHTLISGQTRAYASGDLHQQRETMFDFGKGQMLVTSWAGDVIVFHLIYPDDLAAPVERGAFMLQLGIQGRNVPRNLLHGSLIKLESGMNAVRFDIDPNDLNLRQGFQGALAISARYILNGDQESTSYGKSHIVTNSADGIVAASEARMMLNDERLAAAEEALKKQPSTAAVLQPVVNELQTKASETRVATSQHVAHALGLPISGCDQIFFRGTSSTP